MDIFTTQLTRVVPVPIKPASLKVKALLKEAANSKLTQDPDHLENHEYYFTSEEDEYHANEQKSEQEKEDNQAHAEEDEQAPKQESVEALTEHSPDTSEDEDKKIDKPKHLDLYI
jgi:hypothetical protein